MTRILILYYLLFSGLLLTAQSFEDSLMRTLKKSTNDTSKVYTLIKLAEKHGSSNANKALSYSLQALQLSEKIKWEKGISISLQHVSTYYDQIGETDKALEFQLRELSKSKTSTDEAANCRLMGDLAVSYSKLGDNVKAMQYHLRALKESEKLNLTRETTRNLCNIGTILMELGKRKLALNYHTKSLKLAIENNDIKFIVINHINLGSLYLGDNNRTKALEHFLLGNTSNIKYGNKSYESAINSSLAGTYQFQSDSMKAVGNIHASEILCDKAMSHFKIALLISKEFGNEYVESLTLRNIGELYINKKKYDSAEHYLQESLSLAEKINSIDLIASILEQKYQLAKAQNNYQNALESYENHILFRDSIKNEDVNKTIVELDIKYRTEKKEIENIKLQQKNNLQTLELRNERNLKIGLAILFLLSLILGYVLLRQNKLKAQQQAAQFEQKLLRTQMNPHFIFNSLASIESFIYDHNPKEAGVYLSSFSRLMRLILENSSSEHISLDKEIEFLNYYLALQKLRLDDRLNYIIETDTKLIPEQLLIPPMLTQPFIENAIEHGFRGSKVTGEIKINFTLKNNFIEVQIIDNGIGIEKAQQQKDLHLAHKSMALAITNERLAFLNKSKKRKLSFSMKDLSNDNSGRTGTKIIFLIPIQNNLM